MRSSFRVGVCVCFLALLLMGQEGGCGGAETGSSGQGQTYCELSCGCSGTLGAPASAIEQCVTSCSGSILSEYDQCPSEVAAWGDCLYSTGNCDVNQCLDEIGALNDCADGTGGTGGFRSEPSTDAMGPVRSIALNCFVRGNGDVLCTNTDEAVSSPEGAARMPLDVPALMVAGIDSGGQTDCAVLEDGTVWCWGSNRWGRLGDGSATAVRRSTPGQVSAVANVTDLVTDGFDTFCALESEGDVKCWGDFSFGPDTGNTYETTPVTLELPGPAAAISYGYGPVVLLRSGEVYWADYSRFELVPEANGAVALRNSCAILPDTRAFCVGSKVTQGWGGVSAKSGFYPLDGIVDIYANQLWSLALRNDGSIWWNEGQSGTPTALRVPCDVTADPPLKFTHFKGPYPGRFAWLLTDDGTVVPGTIQRCGSFGGFFECEQGFVSGLFSGSEDMQQMFRSDRDPLCAFTSSCCLGDDECDCLGRANLCGAPSECAL